MFKKKFVIFLFILILFVAGCSNSQDKNANQEDSIHYNLTINGVDVTPGNPFLKDELGKENSYSEIPSCAFDGVDKTYTYDHYEIIVSNVSNEDVIYSVYFLDDEVATEEGIKIADEKSKMIDIYGNDFENVGNEYIYSDGNVDLSFILENDVIVSIEYIMDV